MVTGASTHVFHRHTRAQLPIAVRGEGAYIFDSEGRQYLDASGGAAVSCLGHNHPQVIDAIKAQLDDMALLMDGGPSRLATPEEALRVQELIEGILANGRTQS